MNSITTLIFLRGWPEQALLCTDDPSSTASTRVITPHMGVFADVHMKELVVTARGVRLIRMICQANRLHYAVFREVRFDEIYLEPIIARTLLDSAAAIADALSNAGSVERAA